MEIWFEKRNSWFGFNIGDKKMAVGRFLWSPQKNRSGGDTYANMRKVDKGDIVMHLVRSRWIVGVSKVAASVDMYYKCPPCSNWARNGEKIPAYVVKLKDFVEIKPYLHIRDILKESNRPTLKKFLGQGVFYNQNLKLQQGRYLTRLPQGLAELINSEYRSITGHNLPYLHFN